MGSKAGLGGAKCYIDLLMFAESLPSWLQFGKHQTWCITGMSTTFGEYYGIDRREAQQARYKGLLNAMEIAKRLSITY